jgi:hypothetical protein
MPELFFSTEQARKFLDGIRYLGGCSAREEGGVGSFISTRRKDDRRAVTERRDAAGGKGDARPARDFT